MPEMRKQVKAMEEKYKGIARLKETKEAVKILKNELIWAMVDERKRVSMMPAVPPEEWLTLSVYHRLGLNIKFSDSQIAKLF